MPNRKTFYRIERLEADPEHGLELEQWAQLLALWSAEYRPRKPPRPAEFACWEDRIKTYRRRWAAGEDLFCIDDRETGPMGERRVDAQGVRIRLKRLVLHVYKLPRSQKQLPG